MVLNDWNTGKIKYCTHPPEEEKGGQESEIVSTFATEFSLDELERGEKMDLQNLPLVRPSEMVDLQAGVINDKAAEMEDMEDEEEMEAENDENVLPANVETFAKKGKRQERKFEEKVDPLFKLEGNLRLEKAAKMLSKKNKKERKRAQRVGDTLSNQMENAFSKLNE